MSGLDGCGSHSCYIKKPSGQGTNGSCTCRPAAVACFFRAECAKKDKQIAELESETQQLRIACVAHDAQADACYGQEVVRLEKQIAELVDGMKTLDSTYMEAATRAEKAEARVKDLEAGSCPHWSGAGCRADYLM